MPFVQIRIVLGVSALLVAAGSARGQSPFELGATSVGGGTGGALIGGIAGLLVDGAYCQRHHGKEPSIIFGPCFFYTGAATPIGWFGGAAVGGTWGAVHVAEKQGCARNAAIMRAVRGAVMGVAPGILMMTSGAGRYPPLRSMFIAGAPVLSGAGAAIAVRGCHPSHR